MGRLIKQALYSYQYEEDKKFRELDRKRKLITKWMEDYYGSNWHPLPQYYGLIKVMVRED